MADGPSCGLEITVPQSVNSVPQSTTFDATTSLKRKKSSYDTLPARKRSCHDLHGIHHTSKPAISHASAYRTSPPARKSQHFHAPLEPSKTLPHLASPNTYTSRIRRTNSPIHATAGLIPVALSPRASQNALQFNPVESDSESSEQCAGSSSSHTSTTTHSRTPLSERGIEGSKSPDLRTSSGYPLHVSNRIAGSSGPVMPDQRPYSVLQSLSTTGNKTSPKNTSIPATPQCTLEELVGRVKRKLLWITWFHDPFKYSCPVSHGKNSPDNKGLWLDSHAVAKKFIREEYASYGLGVLDHATERTHTKMVGKLQGQLRSELRTWTRDHIQVLFDDTPESGEGGLENANQKAVSTWTEEKLVHASYFVAAKMPFRADVLERFFNEKMAPRFRNGTDIGELVHTLTEDNIGNLLCLIAVNIMIALQHWNRRNSGREEKKYDWYQGFRDFDAHKKIWGRLQGVEKVELVQGWRGRILSCTRQNRTPSPGLSQFIN